MSLLPASSSGEVSTGFYNGATSRSLRMQDARLTRTPSSTGNPKKWTFSAWLKRTSLGQSYIFAGSPLASGYDGIAAIYFNGSDQLHTYYDTSGSNPYGNVSSETRVYRDLGSWYHLCWAVDAENTIHKIWINNNLVSTNTSRYPPNFTYGLNNSGDEMVIGDGSWDSYGSPNFNGYMAEINYLDGQYLEPDSFTETKNGVLIPLKDPSLTYGTNGFRLQFLATGTSADSSGIGADTSGQGNHYAVTSLAAGDVVTDNPENNFATMLGALAEPQDYQSYYKGTYTEGNLKVQGSSSGWTNGSSNFGVASGKWYAECTVNSWVASNYVRIGLRARPARTYDEYFVLGNGTGQLDGTTRNGRLPSFTTGDVIQFALDLENNAFYLGKNNTWGNSATATEIANGTTTNAFASGSEVPTGDGHDYFFYAQPHSSGTSIIWNFGQDGSFANTLTGGDVGSETDSNGEGAFKYAPPSGFLALCSSNLPDVTIGPDSTTQADNHFDTLIWTGDGSSPRNIDGLNFKPDFIWDKARDGSTGVSHVLYDSSRGVKQILSTDQTSLESTLATGTSAFRDDGFTVNAFSNANGQGRAAFCWKANGGTTTTNDASSTGVGTIDSVFQADTTSGFSIVTYTGTGSAGTVKHGLSVAPSLVIIKSRTTASPSNWVIGQDQSGFTGQNYFTDISPFGSNSGSFNNTAPTSSVVSIGTDQTTNGNTATYVMYCFANVEGFSRISSYEMNYNSDGTFVYTGFRPAWLLTRPVDQNGNWSIYDTVREPFNDGDSNMFFAGLNYVESSFAASAVDFLSNGFKLRQSSDGYSNIASNTAIYMAFAEQPFKFSNAR